MLRLRVCGVGDGDCIIIELPDGRFGLVDSHVRPGEERSPALGLLSGKELVFCCLTHPDKDHLLGMADIIQDNDISVGEFWYALSDLHGIMKIWTNPSYFGEATDLTVRLLEQEYGLLADLFDVVGEAVKPQNVKMKLGVQGKEIAGVQFVVFGPDDWTWNRYRKRLDRARCRGEDVPKRYNNRLSICILMRYGDHKVWLLGDLPRAQLRKLPDREYEDQLPAARGGVCASVLKVPHHGAKDGLFSGMSKTLLRCHTDDVVVFSAAGGDAHPDGSTWAYWEETEKRIASTWTGHPTPSRSMASGSVRFLVDERTRAIPESRPRDILITVPSEGEVSFDYLDVCE